MPRCVSFLVVLRQSTGKFFVMGQRSQGLSPHAIAHAVDSIGQTDELSKEM